MPDRGVDRGPLLKIATWVAVIVAAVFLAQTYQRAYRTSGNDFSTYLSASRAFWSGTSPYDIPLPFPYVYPLLLAALIGPLTLVPYWLAVLFWFLLSVACLVYAVWGTLSLALASHAVMPPPGMAYAAGAVAVALHAGIIQNNLLNGQVNLILLALMVAAARQTLAGSTGPAGLAFGTSIALKLTPLALVPYFLLRNRWLLVAGALAIAAVFCLIPAFWLGTAGLSRATTFLGGFAGEAFTSPAFRDGQPLTFSVGGVLAERLPLSPLAASVIGITVVGVVLLALEGMGRRRERTTAAVWMLTAYLIAIPLISPMSETHHLVLLIPAACLVVCAAIDPRGGPAMIWLFGAFAPAVIAAQLAKQGMVYLVAMLVLVTAIGSGLSINRLKTTSP